MSRHERDAVSLMGGLLLVLLAVGLLVQDLTDLRLDPGLAAAAALVVVGVSGLWASARSAGTATDT